MGVRNSSSTPGVLVSTIGGARVAKAWVVRDVDVVLLSRGMLCFEKPLWLERKDPVVAHHKSDYEHLRAEGKPAMGLKDSEANKWTACWSPRLVADVLYRVNHGCLVKH